MMVPELNPLFHQPVRTRIAALLCHEARTFSELKALLQVTDGNLDAHLRKLGAAGYLHSRMVTGEARPQTRYQLSETGYEAFAQYMENVAALFSIAAST